jgi:ABC-type multidrug transport system fused ATPase/permease subunit
LRNYWSVLKTGNFGRSIRILPPKDLKKLLIAIGLQILVSFMDLLGVLAVGLLGSLSVTGIQSTKPSDEVNSILVFLNLSGSTFQQQALVIGFAAVVLLVGRTLLSIFFTRRIMFFLSRRGAKISSDLVAGLLSQPLVIVQSRTSQETLYAVTRGVELIVLQVLATSVVLVSDISLLFVMVVGLLLINPLMAIGTLILFSAVAGFLYYSMHVRAGVLGLKNSQLNILSNEKIVEVIGSYREAVVRNRRDFYAREIGKLRLALANTLAETNFMPYVSKYVIETTVIFGALLVGASQFLLQDTTQAVSTVAIFLAAGTRIAPAVLRLQQGTLQIRNSLGQATPTLDLIESIGKGKLIENVDDTLDLEHLGFTPEIILKDISFTYPNRFEPAISEISLAITPGSFVAFVGQSGSGKTTTIDVLLGVLDPSQGSVAISGLDPLSAVSKWPGAVSYVPQDVLIASGTIRENVALGFPSYFATNDLVMNALEIAQLDKFVSGLPNGMDTQVGEQGAKISGGQRQRLGIARAMFTRPHLLVLDEATSALDGETEASVSLAIRKLRGSTTVVLIAHRLSTIQNADVVVYLSQGKVKAMGTFNEVRDSVAEFDHQAKLMGL